MYQAQGKPSGTHGLFHKFVSLNLNSYSTHAPVGIGSMPLLSSGCLLKDHTGSIRSGGRSSIRIAGQSVDSTC